MNVVIKKLPLAAIRIDGDTQPRVELNEDVVSEYAETMTDGESFPPPVVYHDGAEYWLADGFHRFHAARKAGVDPLQCEIRQGTRRDAILHSVGANAEHGLRRKNEDKHQAVETLLNDPEWRQWSDREIARVSKVSKTYVNNIRSNLTGNGGQSTPIRKGADGRTINTANIGNFGPPPPAPSSEEAPPPLPPSKPEPNAISGKIRDAVGRTIPDNRLDIWTRAQEAQELQTAISRVRSIVRNAQDDEDVLFAELNFSHVMAHLDQAYTGLGVAKPYALCPYCHGDGCRVCCDRGLVSKYRWDNACAQEFKDAAIAEGRDHATAS